MADNFDAKASLEVALDGVTEVINGLERIKAGIGDVGDAQADLRKIQKGLQKDLEGVGDAAAAAGSKASKAAKGWEEYDKALKKANKTHRKDAKDTTQATVKPGDIPDKPVAEMSKAELQAITAVDAAKKANLVTDAKRRLAAIEKAEQAELRSIAAVEKARVAAAKRESAARVAATAKERATYDRGLAPKVGPDRSSSLLVGSPRTAAQSQIKATSLADWDKQFAAASATLASVSKAEASLPRLRYALYDVATTAGIAGTAIAGVGVATVAAFASMESSFTNVERTLDSVSGEKVQALRQELVGLTREIPQSFANISEIATLGNQLGINAGDIAKFTETTAKFSAVTGLTAEASAQAFGSLGQLLHVRSRDYEALGSSIALVGRKSVATEQEIVAMTTRLAASATNAGFTAQQVIALSGAFASLRIAPERAQGVMEVYFNRLNTAIAEGGPRLEAFARITGQTTDEVARLAQTDPTGFFQKLAVSLGNMNQVAQTGALEELGLQGIRAGEVFGRISANVNVFDKALQDANQGWSQGTELGAQYAKVVDDLASRWQIFLNAVQEAGAAVGATLAPALGLILANVTDVIQAFAAFAQTPIGAIIVGVAGAVGALVAGLAGLAAISALSLASMAAMSTALKELTVASGASVLSLRTLSAAVGTVGAGFGFSTGAIRVFKGALLSTGIGAAVVLLGTFAAGLLDATSSASGLSAELQPLADSLARAIESDTATFNETGEHIAVVTQKLKDNAPAADRAAEAAENFAGVQSGTSDSVAAATAKIKEQTIALGANADAVLRNNLASDTGFKEFANDPALRAAAQQAGFTVDQLITQAISTSGGATAYVDQLRQKAQAAHDAANAAIATGGIDDAETQRLTEYAFGLQQVVDKLSPVAGSLDAVRANAIATGNANEYAGTTAAGMGEDFTAAGDSASNAAGGLYDAQSAAIAAQNELFNLGSTLGENAGMWDVYSEAGRGNLSALYSWMTAVAGQTGATTSGTAANFAAMYQALIDGGVATANQLVFLRDAAASLAGMSFSDIKPATVNFANLFNGIDSGARKAAKAIGGGGGGGGGGGKGSLTKEIRTLVDYANDLSSVIKRAFDIRFGGQQGLDQITSGWQKIRNAADEARESVDEHRRTLAGMAADKKIKQYWLMVAENYGDELRAAKLRAELADLSADQAKEQKDLSKAQDKASKTLVGNSEAAIDNRAEILGLVGNYQDYLKSLAASGMSQQELQAKSAQLRAEFVQQAVSMGYNRGQVEQYARAFDDMAIVIRKVPRNITITANANPALQALAEFEAKAKKAGAAAGKGYGGAFGNSVRNGIGTFAAPKSTTSTWKDLGYKNGRAMRSGVINGIGVIKIGNKNLMAPGSEAELYGWARGGYTGDGGVNDVAGIVHKGEYVMSQAATRTIGVQNLAYMHSMAKAGKSVAPVGLGAAGGMTELSPFDRGLLMEISAAIRAGLVIDGRTLQSVVNGGNAAFAQRRGA